MKSIDCSYDHFQSGSVFSCVQNTLLVSATFSPYRYTLLDAWLLALHWEFVFYTVMFHRSRRPEVPALWAASRLWKVVLSWSAVTSSYRNSQVHSKGKPPNDWTTARNVDSLVEVYQPTPDLDHSHWSSWESSCGGGAPGSTAERQVLPTNWEKGCPWLPHPTTIIPYCTPSLFSSSIWADGTDSATRSSALTRE